jgi:hypothetical protein
VLKAGDKCPKCREGLLVRVELGFACDECSYQIDLEDLTAMAMKKRTKAGDYVFGRRIIKFTIEDPEEAEEFLRGVILARQNNSSYYFVDLIDALNGILEPWRAARLAQEMEARGTTIVAADYER